MGKLTPEEFAEKYARRLKNATDDIRQGVQKVDVSPGVKAAQKQEKMLQNIQKAVQEGTWARRVSAVSVDEWKQKMIEKGLSRIASGVDGAKPKVQDFARQLLEYQDGLQARISKMPDLTLEDGINRMTEWVRGMAKFKKK